MHQYIHLCVGVGGGGGGGGRVDLTFNSSSRAIEAILTRLILSIAANNSAYNNLLF